MFMFDYFDLFTNNIETDLKPYKMFLFERFPNGSRFVNIF